MYSHRSPAEMHNLCMKGRKKRHMGKPRRGQDDLVLLSRVVYLNAASNACKYSLVRGL